MIRPVPAGVGSGFSAAYPGMAETAATVGRRWSVRAPRAVDTRKGDECRGRSAADLAVLPRGEHSRTPGLLEACERFQHGFDAALGTGPREWPLARAVVVRVSGTCAVMTSRA